MSKTRVLVVDDSAFMRKVISDIVNADPQLEVIGTARDGADALKKISELQPDVVTMDVEMPVMDGLTALERIMATRPLPVIMLSSITNDGAAATMKALEKGAFDFIPKPSGPISLDIEKVQADLVTKIKTSRTARLTRLVPPKATAKSPPVPRPVVRPTVLDQTAKPPDLKSVDDKMMDDRLLDRLVVIGTSTGGPKALNEVIPALPADFPAGVLIVQHMPPGFTRSLAERLDNLSAVRVKEAEDGEEVRPGVVYIAPGDYHLETNAKGRRLFVRLTKQPPVSGHRPSVDTMISSVAESYWGPVVAVILTGMGGDGTQGLKKLKNRGSSRVIAEDQSTCVVYGMPKTAVEAGCVDKVVPLTQVAVEIKHMI